MRPYWTFLPRSPSSTHIHPALTSSFADDVCATAARLFIYVGALALIAILGVHFWDRLPQPLRNEATTSANWSIADHSYPAFALGAHDPANKSVTYTVLRHPEGGRKDVFSWIGADNRVTADLEIYQMGDESRAALPPADDLALRMPPGREIEAAGVVDSKFGTVALVGRAKAKDGPTACLGFFKSIANPAMRISGWTCQGNGLPARRTAIACMLDRLTLLTAGNEPALAELFAHAELERRNCAAAGNAAASNDWITQADNPRLRGAL
jgi:hypothetical protein